MKRFLGMGVALVALIGAAAVANAAQIIHIMGVDGVCTAYETPLRSISGRCASHVLNYEFDNHAVSFTYIVRGKTKADAALVSFYGQGQNEIHEGPNRVVLPIERVFLDANRVSSSIAAAGSCTFGNPYHRVAPIDCVAHTGEGTFKFTFHTNGGKPDVFK